MVKVEVRKDDVVFKLEGVQKFLALKSNVKIPLKNIDDISTKKVKQLLLASRIGTHVPRSFMAGTFWVKEGKTFYYVRDGNKCITLKLKNHEYSRVVIEVDDKESIAYKLRKAIQE